ncbi:MAG: hypothetical protein ABEI06_02380 [Halobacteriaceae archaeon]
MTEYALAGLTIIMIATGVILGFIFLKFGPLVAPLVLVGIGIVVAVILEIRDQLQIYGIIGDED